MKFDDILVYLGEFGLYQKRLYCILCVPIITSACHALITAFIAGLPEHRCAIPGLDNDSYAVQGAHHQFLINANIPIDGSDYSQCQLYDIPKNKAFSADLPVNFTNKSQIPCRKWVFDKTVFQTTVTEQMSLVCGDLIRRSHLYLFAGLGAAFGAVLLGTLSDIFGRKKVLYTSLVVRVIVGVATVWAPEYISLCVSRFLQSFCGAGIFVNAFTIGIELVGKSKRLWAGLVIELVWVLGSLILSGVSYLIRDWQYLQLAISLPGILYLAIWWMIPESPRWLLANGQTAKAQQIIQRAARVNKVTLSEGVFDNILDYDNDRLPKVKIWQMFKHRRLLIRSIIIFFNWCVVSMVYFGLTVNSAYLYGSVHLNFFLSAIVESLGYLLCFPLLDRIGRKILHTSAMLVGGIACCCTIFTELYLPKEYQLITTALALVGKMGSSAAYAVIYIYSSEIFPTVIRSGALGISTMSAEVGGIMCAYIADLGLLFPGPFGVALPLMVFGGASIIAGLTSLALPETLNKNLPDTIEDALNFGKQENLSANGSEISDNNVVGVCMKRLDGQDNTPLKNNGDIS